jgi:drug/metabolite transporter (DMT)-like permease
LPLGRRAVFPYAGVAAPLRPPPQFPRAVIALPATNTQTNPAWTAAVLVLMPVLFSSNLILGRAAVATIAPFTLAFWRWLLASLIMGVVVAPALRRHAADLLRLTPLLLVLGVLGMLICGAGVYVGLSHTTATNGTLIYTTSPAFIVLFEMILGRRPFSLLQFAGIALATFGVAVIVSHGDVAGLLSVGFNPGDIIILAAAISWAVYSILLHDRRLQALPGRVTFAAIAMSGTLVLTPAWLFEGSIHGFAPATASGWASVAALAVMPSVLAFLAYQWLVREVGAARTGMALYFMPIVGVGLAAIFLGEAIHLYHLAGTLTTIGGVVLATLSGPRQRAS